MDIKLCVVIYSYSNKDKFILFVNVFLTAKNFIPLDISTKGGLPVMPFIQEFYYKKLNKHGYSSLPYIT